MLTNIPEVKLGIVAVSRDCFIISLSERRRSAVAAACREQEQTLRDTGANHLVRCSQITGL